MGATSQKAIALLRSIVSDCEAMRVNGSQQFQATLVEDEDWDGYAIVDWPNLAIDIDQAKQFLAEVEAQEVTA